ncbi:unnamed protein product [Lactuca virosa]|uniref:Uncharacterized protein n=1 Tax=Lactuca virosa TaxID=75947 RepID=A0AAU9P8P7_9ASTR|nr:unnamed protein product [Lactuca virosa]
MEKVDKKISRFLQCPLWAQVLADVHHVRFETTEWFDRLEGSAQRLDNDSPLQWLRADPEMEYLAEIHFNQPVQMWINQLEKDKDVVAQAKSITALELFPRLLSIINALSNLLCDSQAFWRVRIEAAFALASTASEETDWDGLLHLIKFYKSRRYDEKIGLPKPNDFHDFAEYLVLEAIPHVVALVRAADKKSPREAVDFILQLLKYNENNVNPYSDVFWLAALVQSVGELEFGQQTTAYAYVFMIAACYIKSNDMRKENKYTDNQSVDRAYHIGQKKDVIVYRLMTCGTVEENIYRQQGVFKSATEDKEQIRNFDYWDLKESFSLPEQGFDVSLTQQQLHKEHDSEPGMFVIPLTLHLKYVH